MKNTIAERISRFLMNYPPFSELTDEELINVATDIRVLNLEKNKTLFQLNDPLHDCFYVVVSGIINLSINSDTDETLLHKCISGDILGLRPFFAKNNYMMTAKAREESIVFAIPISTFKPFAINNAKVLDFLLQSFASTSQNPSDKYGKLVSDTISYKDNQSEIQFFQSLDYNRNPLTVAPTAVAMNVAQLMTDNLYGCVIVHQKNLPVGIITDVDLRTKIATGKFHTSTLASNIMTTPVITVNENLSVAEAQLIMLRSHVTHLCVTVDGSDKTAIKGIISQQDLINAQANNPGVMIKEIKRSQSPNDLKNIRYKLSEFIRISINKKIPLSHINIIASEVNMTLIKRSIDLAILDLGSPPAPFSWLCLGSQARQEQLLLTDQDSMIIFEDVPAEKYRDVKDYFQKLAKRATNTLEFIGYPLCPHGHSASNLIYNKSLSEWTEQYNNWIISPDKSDEMSSIFFDFEIAYGDSSLEKSLTAHIFENLKDRKKFFAFLANETLKKPAPLSFFKSFNVEEDGEHKDLFDIKNRALMPLIGAARVLTLSYGFQGINNTFSRFKKLASEDLKHAEIYHRAADDFITLSKLRTIEGLKNGTDGQFIDLSEMSKAERENLKHCFHSMKELEEIIKSKFHLTYFS